MKQKVNLFMSIFEKEFLQLDVNKAKILLNQILYGRDEHDEKEKCRKYWYLRAQNDKSLEAKVREVRSNVLARGKRKISKILQNHKYHTIGLPGQKTELTALEPM